LAGQPLTLLTGEKKNIPIGRPIFTISIDTELAWGSFDRDGLRKYEKEYAQEREIIRDLLLMFERYRIKATWAIVGHLFLQRCAKNGPNSHSHVLEPQYSWYPDGWLSHDPFSDVSKDPFFYAPDIVDAILGSSQKHEIASHTFSHAILGDAECSADVARSQLTECRRLAEEKGLHLHSVVFPRNSIGHLDILCELGFTCFRGREKTWYSIKGAPKYASKLFHFADKLLALSPPVYTEIECLMCGKESSAIVNVPASMFFAPYKGLWRLVRISDRIRQAKKGLASAIQEKALFHLWFHPVNLASSSQLIDALEEILFEVSKMVEAGNMHSMTMEEIASQVLSES
jgi:peptidoglycan/xylan/chitin deacetylase (PgdA/CDA1 family)